MKKNLNLKKRLINWAIIVAAILSIPLITKAPWGVFDFIFAGVVLFGSAAGYEIISSKMKNPLHRLITAILAIGAVIFIWFLAVSGP